MRQTIIKYIILCCILFSSILLSAQNRVNKGSNDDVTDVLFLGSSYFGFNNLPRIFDSLSFYGGIEVYIDSHIPGGWYLSDHASDSITEVLINSRDWDYVVLQGVGSVIAYPHTFTGHPVQSALETLKQKINLNCADTKILFCLPWAYEDGMLWYGWDDTYADMQEIIYETTLSFSNEIGFSVAPVGWAWYEVLGSLNYPLHYLHLSDWNHPSVNGSYLMACVIYASVFLESVENNTYYLDLPEQDALWFQQVASDIVLGNLELWNLADTAANAVIEEPVKPSSVSVFPNPVKRFSTINYQVSEPGVINLSIVNIKGETIKELFRGYQNPGFFSVNVGFSEFRNGIYFIKMEENQKRISRKFIISK